jgi:hypothetical protein
MGIGVALQLEPAAELQVVEADMAVDRTEAREMQLEQCQDRVGRDHEVPEGHCVIDEGLHRMHRERGPGRRVDRFVVHRMHPLVEQGHVDQPVDHEEMHFVQHRREEGECREIDRVIGPAQPRHRAGHEAPQEQHFDAGPERDADQEGAQGIVDILALEPEGVRGTIGGKAPAVFELCPLLPADVEKELDRPVHHEDRRGVDGIEPQRPVPAQGLHHVDVRNDQIPIGERRRHVEGVPGEEVSRQPFQNRDGIERPVPIGRQRQPRGRFPVAPRVTRSGFEVVHPWKPAPRACR